MNPLVFVLLAMIAFARPSVANNLPLVVVEDSGDPKVDDLVVQLISKQPAPCPTGYRNEAGDIHSDASEIDAAMKKLIQTRPTIFPALVTHLDDDRYSYSSSFGTWVNWTVGHAVAVILSQDAVCPYQYKSRPTPTGPAECLIFHDYLRDRDPQKWAEWAKNKTRPDIRNDFLQWCLATEKARVC